MADKGIIFSAPMVRALLDGRKTQTRRLLSRNWSVLGSSWRGKKSPWDGLDFSKAVARTKNTMAIALVGSENAWPDPHLDVPFLHPEDAAAGGWWEDEELWYRVRPPFELGDRLYVREAAWIAPPGWTDSPANPMGPHRQEVAFAADDRSGYTAEAAKDYNLRLRPSIHMPRRASRLWLAVTDVRVQRLRDISEADCMAEGIDGSAITHFGCPVKAYAALWDHLHGGESDHGWAANPWIVAVTFEVHPGNIDGAAR